MAEALYNKYRPQIFEDVVGQEHIERTLKNAIASDKISHAYMFTGPRGTGKTTTARLLSKALICEKGPTPDPDGTCDDCMLIAAGEHPDVYELDAASRTGVENVREEIIGKVHYAPTRGRYKVYIIDEVHMLSTPAFNALLKTLEEPPDHVVFILCTTDPQKVPETILSRCQRFDFRRISSEELISRLGAICEMEGVRFEGDALDLIAHRAQGGMRDALTSLEQLIAFGEGEVTTALAERLLGSLDSSDLADIVRAIGERDVAACFRWTSEYMETGADLAQFVADFTEHMRDMYVMSLAGADVALEVTEAGRRELELELSWYGPERLSRLLGVLGDLANELKTSTNQRLSFEIALTRMVRPESDITIEALSERIEALERALAAGVMPKADSAKPAQPRPEAREVFQGEASEARPFAEQEHASKEPANSEEPRSKVAASGDADAAPKAASIVQPTSTSTVQPTNAACASSDDVRDATRLWDSVLAHLKKIGPAYSVIFMNTAPSIDGGKLTIAFGSDSDFAFRAAQKPEAREALEKALGRAGAQGMPYDIVQNDGAVAPVRATAQEPKPTWQAQEPRSVQQEQERQPQQARQQQQPHQPQQQQPHQQLQQPHQSQQQQQPQQPEEMQDPDFSDFLTAAFGENLVIEEIE